MSVGGAARRPGDPVADLEPAALALAGGELDDLAGATAGGGLERAQRRLDPDHDLLVVDEDDVDREPHEGRVDRPGGPEHDALPAGSARRPSSPRMRRNVVSATVDRLADDPAVLAPQRQRSPCASLTRLAERRS